MHFTIVWIISGVPGACPLLFTFGSTGSRTLTESFADTNSAGDSSSDGFSPNEF